MTQPTPRPAALRLRLDVAYDGSAYSGWAAQPGLRTVQGTLEDALSTVLRLSGVSLTVAGRTDAGVHARGQVCHVDLPVEATSLERTALGASAAAAGDLRRLVSRLASLLPDDVRVRDIALAPAGFDARFSALWRRYIYRICDNPAGADPLLRGHVLTWPRRLDEYAMGAAASGLLGEHDFAAFCKRRKGATTVRALRRLKWSRSADLLVAEVVADAFCHHMVRSLVGCLVAVGEGRRPVEWPLEVLRKAERDPAVKVVPARGLTLEEVRYPPDSELSARAERSRAVRTVS